MANSDARLVFLGERALAEGFALIGFDTWPDADMATLDRVLDGLRRARCGALVIIDQQLADSGSRLLAQTHAEGRDVVVIEVPNLARPQGFRLAIDDQVQALLGAQASQGANT